MGEVYRARDSKLKREVALKVLPEASPTIANGWRASSAKRKCSRRSIIHTSRRSTASKSNALVMELVEGEDLSQRIARGRDSDRRSAADREADRRGARSGARAGHHPSRPEAGQHQGPADGTVKVLDFGLAKALDAGIGIGTGIRRTANSPTITSPAMTMRGVILGTAAYMSPEQAKGKAVDKRADIWAFGCVLYEMLTGRAAFDGEDVTDTIAAVIEQASRTGRGCRPRRPPHRALLRRCLEKDPQARLARYRRRAFRDRRRLATLKARPAQ